MASSSSTGGRGLSSNLLRLVKKSMVSRAAFLGAGWWWGRGAPVGQMALVGKGGLCWGGGLWWERRGSGGEGGFWWGKRASDGEGTLVGGGQKRQAPAQWSSQELHSN